MSATTRASRLVRRAPLTSCVLLRRDGGAASGVAAPAGVVAAEGVDCELRAFELRRAAEGVRLGEAASGVGRVRLWLPPSLSPLKPPKSRRCGSSRAAAASGRSSRLIMIVPDAFSGLSVYGGAIPSAAADGAPAAAAAAAAAAEAAASAAAEAAAAVRSWAGLPPLRDGSPRPG